MCKYNLDHNKFKHEHIMMHAYLTLNFLSTVFPITLGLLAYSFLEPVQQKHHKVKQSNLLHISH